MCSKRQGAVMREATQPTGKERQGILVIGVSLLAGMACLVSCSKETAQPAQRQYSKVSVKEYFGDAKDPALIRQFAIKNIGINVHSDSSRNSTSIFIDSAKGIISSPALGRRRGSNPDSWNAESDGTTKFVSVSFESHKSSKDLISTVHSELGNPSHLSIASREGVPLSAILIYHSKTSNPKSDINSSIACLETVSPRKYCMRKSTGTCDQKGVMRNLTSIVMIMTFDYYATGPQIVTKATFLETSKIDVGDNPVVNVSECLITPIAS
jgi:hypothetical protein